MADTAPSHEMRGFRSKPTSDKSTQRRVISFQQDLLRLLRAKSITVSVGDTFRKVQLMLLHFPAAAMPGTGHLMTQVSQTDFRVESVSRL